MTQQQFAVEEPPGFVIGVVERSDDGGWRATHHRRRLGTYATPRQADAAVRAAHAARPLQPRSR